MSTYLHSTSLPGYWNNCHRELNGSIGITHDFDAGESSVRIAPRTLLVTERIGATDGFFYCAKDRKSRMRRADVERHRETQRLLLGHFRRIYARHERARDGISRGMA